MKTYMLIALLVLSGSLFAQMPGEGFSSRAAAEPPWTTRTYDASHPPYHLYYQYPYHSWNNYSRYPYQSPYWWAPPPSAPPYYGSQRSMGPSDQWVTVDWDAYNRNMTYQEHVDKLIFSGYQVTNPR